MVDYQQIIKDLSQIALFGPTTSGVSAMHLELERIQKLAEYFDNPQDKIKTIHVAGTNGKGSTCAMLAAILHRAGYKTGLYTSPHLIDYTERIRIAEKDISRNALSKLLSDTLTEIRQKKLPATQFEILAIAAFRYFYQQQVDFAIIETGLGGRLDATNIITQPQLTIITKLGMDHTQWLGNTIEEIAREKAGIIKKKTPLVTFSDNPGLNEILQKAEQKNAIVHLVSEKDVAQYKTNLQGEFQKKNMALAVKATEIITQQGYALADTDLCLGLQQVQWPGRFQYIPKEQIILDGAHNLDGARELRKNIDKNFPTATKLWIYSCLNTKDYPNIIQQLFSPQDIVILTRLSQHSGEKPENIAEAINEKYPMIEYYLTENLQQALKKRTERMTDNTLTIITGSLYLLGEYLQDQNEWCHN